MVTRKDALKKQSAVKRPTPKKPPARALRSVPLQSVTALRASLKSQADMLAQAHHDAVEHAIAAAEVENALLDQHLTERDAPPVVEAPAPLPNVQEKAVVPAKRSVWQWLLSR